MNFLEDVARRVIIEFYHRPVAVIADFVTAHPLTFHVDFVSENVQSKRERLEKQGAFFVEEIKKGDGTHIVMLHASFRMSLQRC